MNEMLKKIYQELVNYFGDEELVNNAINSIHIINSNSIYDSLKEKKLLDNFAKNSYDKLKIIGGIYLSIPYAKLENNNYYIDKLEKYVMLCKFRSDDMHSIGALVHELCHVIKSYRDEFIIKDNYLINNSGVLRKEFKLNDNFEIVGANIFNVALEEALTVFQEEEIMKRLGYSNYISLSYLGVNNIIRDLINTFDLEKLIIRCELNHDILELKDFLGIYFDDFDNILTQTFKMDSSLVINKSKEDKEEKIDKMMKYIDNNYYPLKGVLQTRVRGK